MFIYVCVWGVHSDSLRVKGEKNLTAKTINRNTKIWKKYVIDIPHGETIIKIVFNYVFNKFISYILVLVFEFSFCNFIPPAPYCHTPQL